MFIRASGQFGEIEIGSDGYILAAVSGQGALTKKRLCSWSCPAGPVHPVGPIRPVQ